MASERDAVLEARRAELRMLCAMAGVTVEMRGMSLADVNRAIVELQARLAAMDVSDAVEAAASAVDESMEASAAQDMRDAFGAAAAAYVAASGARGVSGRRGVQRANVAPEAAASDEVEAARRMRDAFEAARRAREAAVAKARSDARIAMGNAKKLLLTDYQAALLEARQLALGANSMDLQDVVNEVVAKLAKKGVTAYTYTTKDGRTVRVPVDVGIRRAVVNAGTEGRMAQTLEASKRSTGLVEVSTTANCRESHAEWQGGIYSTDGDTSRYADFRSACHVGDMRIGFGGWNCGHAVRVYSEKVGKRFRDPLDGTGYSTEEARALTSRQRRLESEVRASKRAAEVLESQGLDASAERARVRSYQAKLKALTDAHPKVLKRAAWREDAGIAARARAGVKGANGVNVGWTLKKGSARLFKVTKGAHTVKSDLRRVNPGYRKALARGDERWTKNCQRCVYAYEMRRRGYDVVAKPRPAYSNGKLKDDWLANGGYMNVMRDQEWTLFKDGNGKSGCDSFMGGLPDGARAVVRVKWKDAEHGHVFVAENIGGKTVYIDPQSGDVGVEYHFDRAKPGATMISAISELEPGVLINSCASSRKR